MSKKVTNTVLCILDGWGINPSPLHNALACSHIPCWNHLEQTYPLAFLKASELPVGLPKGQMGNSEVGHMAIGSGRVIMQDLPRIDLAIEEDDIVSLPGFQKFLDQALKGTKVIHLMGLLSPGGVHSHQNHLAYMSKLVANLGFKVQVHAFLDGRDTPPKRAIEFLGDFFQSIQNDSNIHLATFMGRYFAMDRDKRWDRIEKAYQAIAASKGLKFHTVQEGITRSYEQGISDEFVIPQISQEYTGMKKGDALVMINFRADRVRQLLTALLDPDFREFERQESLFFSATLGMTEYSEKLNSFIPALFKKQLITHTLGEVVSQAGYRQLRVAETEKYAHVTFFFNGGRELTFEGEERQLFPSPQVKTYDLQPEMSAHEITNYLVKKIEEQTYQLTVVNYANPDMVGHTGVQEAIIKAVETIDSCLERLFHVCQKTGTVLVITADHGNVEQMIDSRTGEPHTAHTLNPVPFLVINTPKVFSLENGSLEDVAPTILEIMGLAQPIQMTGKSLIRREIL